MVKLCGFSFLAQIYKDAPFSMAFKDIAGWGWMTNVASACASLGILTSLVVAMLGQSRYMCVIGRSHVIPTWFAKVNSRTGTPLNASLFLGKYQVLFPSLKKKMILLFAFLWVDEGNPFVFSGICTAVLALFTELGILVDLISIGTLFVFYMVANALVYRRYVVKGKTNPWPTLGFLSALSTIAVGFASLWHWGVDGVHYGLWGLTAFSLLAIALTHTFSLLVPQATHPTDWGVPYMPWIPAASIFLNVFLLGSLGWASYLRFAIFSIVALLFYVFYSVHATHDAEVAQNVVETVVNNEVVDSGSNNCPQHAVIQVVPGLPSLPSGTELAKISGTHCV